MSRYEIAYSPKQYVIEYSQQRGPAGRDGESAAAAPIPANTALGNFTEATALPTAQTKSAWITWLDVPTNSDPRLSDARDWFASSVSQAEAEAGTEVIDRKWSALRVRQSTRVNPDWDPTGNLFTIGTSTNAQRLRLRRRFAGAGDFSQLSIDFSGDNCRILTQHAGNNPNPLNLGTAGVERLFIAADATRVGIGGAPTTRPLEIFAGTAGFRLQSSSAVSPPVYTEIARTFDFLTWQDSTSPFNTCTDLVANSNQFNNHSVRLFVHTSGVSAPVLSTVFHSSGNVGIGSSTDDNNGILQLVRNLTGSQALSHLSLSGTWNTTGTPTAIDLNITDTASNAASLLLNLRTGGTSRFSVSKAGNATANQIVIGGSGSASNPLIFFNGAGTGNESGFYRSSFTVVASAQGTPVLQMSYTAGTTITRDNFFGWSSGQFDATTSSDLRLFRDAANTLAQRNGTNGQISRIYKTFTSATNFETFEIDASSDASNYRIGSRIGSAGGTTRGLQLGSYNAAGAWTSWLGIGTTGSTTINGADQVLTLNSSTSFSLVRCAISSAPTQFMEFGRAGSRFQIACQGNLELEFQTNNTRRMAIAGTGEVTVVSHITSAFQSLSADPSTIDIPSGSNRIVKNTTSGEIRDWVNDGGIMKKSPAYT